MVEIKKEDEFVSLFGEKFWITTNDFSDKDLKDKIKVHNYKENFEETKLSKWRWLMLYFLFFLNYINLNILKNI